MDKLGVWLASRSLAENALVDYYLNSDFNADAMHREFRCLAIAMGYDVERRETAAHPDQLTLPWGAA